MKSRLLTKQFWIRFASYFFWYLVVYVTITYLFRDKGEQFWSLTNLADKFAFALFMALIFATWNNKNSKIKTTPADPSVSKPTIQEFLGTYLIILVFILPILAVLLGVCWGFIELFSHNDEPFWPLLFKSLIVMAVMCLLITGYFSMAQLFSYRRRHKGRL